MSSYTFVSVGNTHVVVFVPDAETAPLTTLGPEVEHHENFTGGVNAEFVQVIDCHRHIGLEHHTP